MRLRFAQAARKDLRNAYAFIAADNPKAARAFVDAVAISTRRLIDMPNLARPGRVEGTRELVIRRGPYVAVYTVTDDEIMIIRLLHGRQDWPT